jgi:hypothetical protein
MKRLAFISCFFSLFCTAQDTTIQCQLKAVTLPEVLVRNNFDYKKFIQQVVDDSSFYKAFKNLRILNFTSYNDIKIFDKKQNIKASLASKTKQIRANGCRTTEVVEEQTTGDFYKENKTYNYLTAELYDNLFFAKGKVCGETNIVKGNTISTSNKTGISKHKEQLKMLFFNPGKKIPGIPFIGNKLDLFDSHAHTLYNYKIDYVTYKGKTCYTFSITPKDDLTNDEKDEIVVDNMTTWFDYTTLNVVARTYTLSYKAGLYDFDVSMEVEMEQYKQLTVPKVLRYNGNWNVIFKKREIAAFTATLFDFKEE